MWYPKEKLLFCVVRERWGPVAAACSVHAPQNTKFPRVDEAKEVERFAKETTSKGMLAWAAIAAVVVGLTAIAMQPLKLPRS